MRIQSLVTGLVLVSRVLVPGVLPAQTDDFSSGNDTAWTHDDPIATAGLRTQNS